VEDGTVICRRGVKSERENEKRKEKIEKGFLISENKMVRKVE